MLIKQESIKDFSDDSVELEKSIEHELVHVKQSSEYGKDYSDKKLRKIEFIVQIISLEMFNRRHIFSDFW